MKIKPLQDWRLFCSPSRHHNTLSIYQRFNSCHARPVSSIDVSRVTTYATFPLFCKQKRNQDKSFYFVVILKYERLAQKNKKKWVAGDNEGEMRRINSLPSLQERLWNKTDPSSVRRHVFENVLGPQSQTGRV